MLVKIAPSLPLDRLCVSACAVTTGLGAVFNVAQVTPGSAAAVIGCGGVGLNVIQGAKIAGASRIIAIDTNPKKQDLAGNLGATHCLSPDPDPNATLAASKPLRPAASISLSRSSAARRWSSRRWLYRSQWDHDHGGFGALGRRRRVNAGAVVRRARLVGCLGGSNIPGREIPRIVDLYERGKLMLDALVGHIYPLDRIGDAIANAERADDARTVVPIDPKLL